MKRTLKIGVAVVLALVVLVLAAAVVLPYVVDTAAYRDDLERVVEQRTGRTLTIEGRTRLSVLPWLGLEVGQVTLGNAPGFGPEPFARVSAADVRVRVLPLLWGEVAIGTVRLRAPEVNLARDASGRTNWADLAPPAAGEPAGDAGAPEPAPAEQGGPGVLAALSLGGLEVRDGQVSWTDAVTGTRYAASAVDLTSGAVRMGEPFPVDLAFDVDSQQPALSGRVQVRGQAMVDLRAQRYALRGLALDTRLQGAALPTGSLAASLAADLTADMAAGTAALTDGDLRALGARVTAEADLKALNAVPALSGQVKVEGADGERLAALLDALVPALQWQPAALAGSYAKARLDGDLGAEGLRVTDLEGSLLGLHLDGHAGLRRLAAAPRLDLELRGEVTDGRRLLSPLADALPQDLRPAALDGARLRAEAAMDTAAGRLNLPAVTLEALGATLRANAAVEDLNAAAPAASGRVELAPFSPRRALERLGMPLPAAADPEAFGEAAFAAAFAAGPDHVRLEGMQATLDQSRLTGSLAVPSFAGPVLRFDLALNGMDVDRYLPPAAEGKAGDGTPATPAEAAGGGAARLPMPLLRRVDVSGEATAGRLQIQGLRLSDLEARLDGREGQLRLHPLTARLYGGQYAGDVRLDARGEAPRVRLSERLSGVAIGPLLKDLTGRGYVAGTADVSLDLAFAGQTADAALGSLDGQGRYRLRDGAVLGVDLEGALNRALAATGRGGAAGAGDGGTSFDELKGTVTVEAGRVRSDDLSLRSRLLDVAGEGAVNLADARLDYRLNARVREQGGNGLGRLAGVTVPVRLTGPVSAPTVKVDLAGMVESEARKALEKEKGEQEKKLRDELEELKEKGRELFNF